MSPFVKALGFGMTVALGCVIISAFVTGVLIVTVARYGDMATLWLIAIAIFLGVTALFTTAAYKQGLKKD